MPQSNQQPVRKAHRLPAEAYASTSCGFFFTVCTRHHGEPFQDRPLADAIVRSLLWTRDRYGWHLFAYCLMPDHLHFVCRPTTPMGVTNAGRRGILPAGVLDPVARFKSFTTREGWKHGVQGELWQRSSYDTVLDGTRSVEDVGRYILDNPVRKGLASTWTEWPYSAIVDPW